MWQKIEIFRIVIVIVNTSFSLLVDPSPSNVLSTAYVLIENHLGEKRTMKGTKGKIHLAALA